MKRCHLIVGGHGGIGQKLCLELVARSEEVILLGRNESRGQAFAASIGQTFIPFDATEEDSWKKLFESFSKEQRLISSVINLAGSILLKPVHLVSLKDFKETLDTNLTTAFLSVKYGAPYLASQNAVSHMVLMSSVAAGYGLVNHEVISAAKAGVEGLVRSAAASFATKNVLINCVSPALTKTPLSEKILSSPEALKASEKMHPLGKVGEPEDCARAILFLVDSKQTWITGQILHVNGGLGTLQSRRV